jgi:hypothetical protein
VSIFLGDCAHFSDADSLFPQFFRCFFHRTASGNSEGRFPGTFMNPSMDVDALSRPQSTSQTPSFSKPASRSHTPSHSSHGDYRQTAANAPDKTSPHHHAFSTAEDTHFSPSLQSNSPHPSPVEPLHQDSHPNSRPPLEPQPYVDNPHYTNPPRRVCLTCGDDAPSGWRRSIDHPGHTVSFSVAFRQPYLLLRPNLDSQTIRCLVVLVTFSSCSPTLSSNRFAINVVSPNVHVSNVTRR